MQKIMKLLSLTVMIYFTHSNIYAAAVEQKELNFKIMTHELLNNEVHYSFALLKPRDLIDQYPDIYELDSLRIIKNPKVRVAVSKSSYVVDQAVGFFDHEKMDQENFVAHIMGNQKVSKLSPQTYQVTVPNSRGFQYVMKSYFDSDDISSLPHSKIIRAVTASKRLDVISQGANSTYFREYFKFSRDILGGVNVMSFIPLKEKKTLIISYSLTVVLGTNGNGKELKKSFSSEAEDLKKLISSFPH